MSMPSPHVSPPSQEVIEDAVCFTSGPGCAPFAAGAIHAWLAVDRSAPLVAAGISLGAVSAAAMQRVYAELQQASPADLERKRWEWYRRYLSVVTRDPIGAIWDSIPDPVDFYASTPPVKDLSVPDSLYEDSEDARRHYYILIQLGLWLANLPLRLSTLANIVVSYVRLKEKYGRHVAIPTFWWNSCKAVIGTIWHVLRMPLPVVEGFFFRAKGKGKSRRRSNMIRPLFGWLWLTSLLIAITTALTFGKAVLWVRAVHFLPEQTLGWRLAHSFQANTVVTHSVMWIGSVIVVGVSTILGLAAASVALPAAFAAVKLIRGGKSLGLGIMKHIIKPLDLTRGVIKPYEAKRQLYDLFGEGSIGPAQSRLSEPAIELLVVCAALEATEQICLQNHVPLVDALTAAIAIPGLFPPVRFNGGDLPISVHNSLSSAGNNKSTEQRNAFDVIDGAAVRSNPIPAFFEWCKEEANHKTARRLETKGLGSPSLHVVYSVPIEPQGNVQDASAPDSLDIVESALLALQLEKRRDTRQEVRQTNYTSQLYEIRRRIAGPAKGNRGPFTIFADEIAPETDIDTGDSLTPDSEKLMSAVASGCRSTLETLYRSEIAQSSQGNSMNCSQLLKNNHGRRKPNSNGIVTGLPEVCSKCTGVLKARIPSQGGPSNGIMQTYGDPGRQRKTDLAEAFPHLSGTNPKVVFLGSGGVFRGAFHIGVVAAMATTRLYPDLVVGASVGALMGGALCNITVGSELNETEVLTELVKLFLQVDIRVALTKTLKTAAKQLGTRARSTRLSPAELSRMVRRGSQADAGYAATGAPPALIDAISYLFTIPHQKTIRIASEFIAGHISRATADFLREIRRETLVNFDIQNAIMGVSLLAGQVERLMRGENEQVNLTAIQPFHNPILGRKPVSFFCTTSFLNAKVSLLLGRDFLTENPSWDAVYAGLSSSAFPAVFAPRRESDFLPGVGRSDRSFGDGGMFDNLPFFPAIEILSAVQASETRAAASTGAMSGHDFEHYRHTVLSSVAERSACPNIFIAAGLDAEPADGGTFDTLFKIKERAASLSVTSKVNTFVRGSEKTVSDLKAFASGNSAGLTKEDLDFLDTSVSAKVICISPTDPEHINPTFAFCRSTGLEKKRVQKSIADGCFRTLRSLSDTKTNPEVQALLAQTNTALTRISGTNGKTDSTSCPYYMIGEKELTCPFAKSSDKNVSGAFKVCKDDKQHHHQLMSTLPLDDSVRTGVT